MFSFELTTNSYISCFYTEFYTILIILQVFLKCGFPLLLVELMFHCMGSEVRENKNQSTYSCSEALKSYISVKRNGIVSYFVILFYFDKLSHVVLCWFVIQNSTKSGKTFNQKDWVFQRYSMPDVFVFIGILIKNKCF